MPDIFARYVAARDRRAYHNRSIRTLMNDIQGVYERRFEGKLYSNMLGNTKRAARDLIARSSADPDDWEKPFVKLPRHAKRTYDGFIELVEREVQFAMRHFYPPIPIGPVVSKYEDLIEAGSVTLRRPGLERVLTRVARKKVAAIYDCGRTYGGHGPTAGLGPGVLHAHANDDDGIAFTFNGTDTLEVVAYGTKHDSAAPGMSGYRWTMG